MTSQIVELLIGEDKVEDAYHQLTKMKPVVVLQPFTKKSEKVIQKSTLDQVDDHKEKKKKSEKVIQKSTSDQVDDHKKKKKKSEKVIQKSSSDQVDDHKKKKKKSEKVIQKSTSDQVDDHKKKKKKSEKVIQKSTSDQVDDHKKKNLIKSKNLRHKSTSNQVDDHKRKKKKSEKVIQKSTSDQVDDHKKKNLIKSKNLRHKSTSNQVDDHKRKKKKSERVIQKSASDQVDDHKKKKRKLEHGSITVKQEPDRKSVLLNLVKPVTVKQEPDRKSVLLNLVKPVTVKQEPDRKSVLLNLVKPVTVKQEPDRKSVLLNLVSGVTESKPNILFEKEIKGPELSCKLVGEKESSGSGENIQWKMECTSSEDPTNTFQVQEQHVSCPQMPAFRHLNPNYQIEQKGLVQSDFKKWSKSNLKIRMNEELLYQSEECILKFLSFCARFRRIDETASVGTVLNQANQSSRLSIASMSTVLHEANQPMRHSVASMTTVANQQLSRLSVASMATVANRSHHPQFVQNHPSSRYHSQHNNFRYYTQRPPYATPRVFERAWCEPSRNWYRERYPPRRKYSQYM